MVFVGGSFQKPPVSRFVFQKLCFCGSYVFLAKRRDTSKIIYPCFCCFLQFWVLSFWIREEWLLCLELDKALCWMEKMRWCSFDQTNPCCAIWQTQIIFPGIQTSNPNHQLTMSWNNDLFGTPMSSWGICWDVSLPSMQSWQIFMVLVGRSCLRRKNRSWW